MQHCFQFTALFSGFMMKTFLKCTRKPGGIGWIDHVQIYIGMGSP